MPINRNIIVIIACVSCMLVLALVVLLTGTLTLFSRRPADFLPPDKIVALFQNITEIEAAEYEKWFPELHKRSNTEGIKTIAIVNVNEQENEIIEFIWKGLGASKSKYWPYEVHVGTGKSETILEPRLKSLSQKPEYREFSRKKRLDESWIYIQRNYYSQSGTILQSVIQNLLFQEAETLTFSKENSDSLVLGTIGNISALKGNASAPLEPQEGNIISVSVLNPAELILKTLDKLHHHEKTFASSLLRTSIQKTLGQSISMEYDILPLLQKNTVLTIGKTASGKTVFAISGTMENEELLSEKINKLHEGRKQMLPFIDILEQKLDALFYIRTLRSTSDKFVRENDIQNGWLIVATQKEDNEFGFFSAQKKKEFAISNNRTEFMNHLQTNPQKISVPISDTLIQSNLRSSGIMDTKTIKELIDDFLPDERNSAPSPFFRHLSGSILWTLEERGAVSEWRFKKK